MSLEVLAKRKKNYSLYLENICFSWVFYAEWMHTPQSINAFLNYETIKSILKINPVVNMWTKLSFQTGSVADSLPKQTF